MSSTEQKNITQPFIDSCYTYGVLPTLLSAAFDNFSIETENAPFVGLGKTPHLGKRLRDHSDPLAETRRLLPVLNNAQPSSRVSAFLLRLCSDCHVLAGNQAVMRLVEGILSKRWNVHFADTGAIKHAHRNTAKAASFLAPGAYSQVGRIHNSIRRISHKSDSYVLRTAADFFDFLARGPRHRKHHVDIKQWCSGANPKVGLRNRYRREADATSDYRKFSPSAIHAHPLPPPIKQKWITTGRHSSVDISLYHYGATYYVKITHRDAKVLGSGLLDNTTQRSTQKKLVKWRTSNELYVLSHRDLKDVSFLLQASSHIKLYHARRILDATDITTRHYLRSAQMKLWAYYVFAMQACGEQYHLRNKLGVYFDVLQWRYLAWKSGDLFYNHSYIMAQKIDNKGLREMRDQTMILNFLKTIPMDMAIDMLGMYKASIYPEVDPYRVVSDQYKLHMSRHRTEWEIGSREAQRFTDTKAYMWYLGLRVLHVKYGTWPGRIREGVEPREWHKLYKVQGLPGDLWREAHDVDLTGTVTVADINDEQYMRQQDSACAPPLWEEYRNYETMKKAPRSHRRKLLYAIQEPVLPHLPRVMDDLNEIGRKLPDGYVGRVEFKPDFSTNIVTGARCERHKDAPRPFYAASPPWGCIISYIDGITRDFLNSVPQSMLGKSTRQKFMDLQSVATTRATDVHTFYMSDDKAKYSPRMDPQSQQLPADFFAEVFDIPAIKAYGPVMYHCDLFYRVNGLLVSYNSNGTDREGMRGASNTWLEVVAQGLSTRLCREAGLIRGKSTFLSFIDDGLRKFSVDTRTRTPDGYMSAARRVIEDVIFGLRVLGRELSWDKTFVSRELFVMLNEIVYEGSFISGGLKSFCTAGDVELKEVMSAADYEQLYFGKMRGAHGVGTPLDLCHYTYVFETLASHYRMGLDLQDNKEMTAFDYRLFCMTPTAFGGAGIRSMLQMGCNEVSTATKEGLGNLMRLGNDYPLVQYCVTQITSHPLEQLSPVDFMREPEQVHVAGPRIKTQRMAAEVRKKLQGLARNEQSRKYMEQDELGIQILNDMGKVMMIIGDVSAEEVRLLYSSSPIAFIDEFIQKLASSTTLAELLGRQVIRSLRRSVRIDFLEAARYFCLRSGSRNLIQRLRGNLDNLALIQDLLH